MGFEYLMQFIDEYFKGAEGKWMHYSISGEGRKSLQAIIDNYLDTE